MTETPTGREQLLITALVGLADTLTDDYDIIDLLDRLAGYSVALLAADAAGILLGDARANLRVVASTDERTEWMDLLQLEAGEGPCLECYRTGVPVSVTDLTAAVHWPRFIAGLLQRGMSGSVHALPLRLRGQPIGTLNLFHQRAGALPAADLAVAQALADVATVGILSERAIRRGEVLAEQLQAALNSRVIIEQAKGVLAERGQLSMDGAFDRLRRWARRHNLRLSDVARQVVDTNLAVQLLADVDAPRATTTPPAAAEPSAARVAVRKTVRHRR
jgi:transcriptional regulator with GAF, ATPase, and Fis domain